MGLSTLKGLLIILLFQPIKLEMVLTEKIEKNKTDLKINLNSKESSFFSEAFTSKKNDRNPEKKNIGLKNLNSKSEQMIDLSINESLNSKERNKDLVDMDDLEDLNFSIVSTEEYAKGENVRELNTTLFSGSNFTSMYSEDVTVKLETTTQQMLHSEPSSTTIPSAAVNETFFNHSLSIQNLSDVCICDLKVNECDINCCCDQECVASQKEVFTECDDIDSMGHSGSCYDSKKALKRYGFFKSSVNELFCIVKNNYHSKAVFREDFIIRNITNFKRNVLRKKIYGFTELEFSVQQMGENMYHMGDVMWSIKKGRLLPFGIPKSGINQQCQTMQNVLYLMDHSVKCLRSVPQNKYECLSDRGLEMKDYVGDLKIVTSPALVKEFNLTGTGKVCFNGTCIKISPYVCKGEAMDKSKCANSSLKALKWHSNACENIVSIVEYEIFHNGTDGIKQVRAYFSLKNITENSASQFAQKIRVKFSWFNAKSEKVFVRSGNPGYVSGRPLLAGRKIFYSNETTPLKKEAIELSFDSKNWLTVSNNKEGICIVGNRKPIAFGENVHHSCFVDFSRFDVSKEKCAHVQDGIFNHLLGDEFLNVKLNNQFNKFVATFGNSRVEETGDWVEVLLDKLPIVSNQVSTVTLPDGYFCKKVVTDLYIDIAYSKMGSYTKPQYKILGVTFHFGSPKEFRFPTRCNCSRVDESSQKIKLSTYVQFIDVRNRPRREFAETPGIEAKLPHDFFYPFFSKSSHLKASSLSFLTLSFSGILVKSYL